MFNQNTKTNKKKKRVGTGGGIDNLAEPAEAYIWREAARGGEHFGRLQHPKGFDTAPDTPAQWWHHDQGQDPHWQRD